MTPPTEVPLRELRDHLSAHLRDVAEGAELIVTSRGRRIARVSPVDAVDPLAELRARGLVREPTAPRHQARGRKLPRPTGSVADIVTEQRR